MIANYSQAEALGRVRCEGSVELKIHSKLAVPHRLEAIGDVVLQTGSELDVNEADIGGRVTLSSASKAYFQNVTIERSLVMFGVSHTTAAKTVIKGDLVLSGGSHFTASHSTISIEGSIQLSGGSQATLSGSGDFDFSGNIAISGGSKLDISQKTFPGSRTCRVAASGGSVITVKKGTDWSSWVLSGF